MISTQWMDDFLSKRDYNEIVEIGNDVHMYESHEYADKYGDSKSSDTKVNFNWKSWRGCRRSANMVGYLDDVADKINKTFDVEVSRLEFFQHPLVNFPNQSNNIPQHIDERFDFSGVLYLDDGAVGLGTTVGDQYIEWKPNRLVVFDAHTPHNPHMGGTERKVLTFFSYTKKF